MLIVEERGIMDMEDLTQWVRGRNEKGKKYSQLELSLQTGLSTGNCQRILTRTKIHNDISLYSIMRLMEEFGLNPVLASNTTGKKVNISERNAYIAMQKGLKFGYRGRTQFKKAMDVSYATIRYYMEVKKRPESLKLFFFVRWMEVCGYDLWFIQGRATE